MKDLQTEKLNNKDRLLAHYCSKDTFDSIIRSGCLRFNDITKSNDSQEIICSIMEDVNGTSFWDKDGIVASSLKSFKFFAISFTELINADYFWKEYAKGDGFCIVVRESVVKEWARGIDAGWNNKVDAKDVIYLYKNERVANDNRRTKSLVEFRKEYRRTADSNIEECISESLIDYDCLFYKSYRHLIEHEFRLAFCVVLDDSNLEKVKKIPNVDAKYKGNNYPVNLKQKLYYEIPFPNNLIHAIIISPGSSSTPEDVFKLIKDNQPRYSISQDAIFKSESL